MRLHEVEAGRRVRVTRVEGTERFVARVSSIGLTPGCLVDVLVNRGRRPVLVHVRDSAIALGHDDCSHVHVEATHGL